MSHSISKLWMPSLGHSWNQCTQPQAPPWETQGYVEKSSNRVKSSCRTVYDVSFSAPWERHVDVSRTVPRLDGPTTSTTSTAPRRPAAARVRRRWLGRHLRQSDGGSMSNRRRKIYIYVYLYLHSYPRFIHIIVTSPHLCICVYIYIGLSRL